VAHLLAGIAWDPQIRGFLAVAVGVVVLMGSVYLLLGTNLGARLGFLVGLSAIFGWCTIMGVTWWMYGTIGMQGNLPTWQVDEVVYAPVREAPADGEEPPDTEQAGTAEEGLALAGLEEAHDLDTSTLPDPDELKDLDEDELGSVEDDAAAELGGWELLSQSNPAFGDAKATVDAHFVEHNLTELGIDSADDYIVQYSFERGGKDDLPDHPSRLDRISRKLKTTFWQVKHPPRYAVIQVQPVVEKEAIPGAAPPVPEADESKPVISVIMRRDLGDQRLPGAMLTIISGLLFLLTLVMLHQRDLQVAQARGLTPGPAEA
jgi:hypothetical protein